MKKLSNLYYRNIRDEEKKFIKIDTMCQSNEDFFNLTGYAEN
jgi:hypothetical protein